MAVTVTKHRINFQPKIAFTFLSALLLVICLPAYSASWHLTPRFDSSLSYIDNVNLASASEAESSGVLGFTPGFKLSGNGRRLLVNMDYRLQSLFYSNNPVIEDGDKSKLFHRFNSTLKSELVQRLLFIDASAAVFQQSSNAIGKASVDNYSITEDRGTTSRYTVSPYIRHQVDNGLRSELRYRYDTLRGKKLIVADSVINTISLEMDSGRILKSWQWTLNLKSSDLNYESESDQTHSSSDFGIRYRISPRTMFSVRGGTEKVKYEPNLGEVGGDYWNVAMELKPGKRSSISLQAGERYYGQSYGLSMRHKSRRGNYGVDYKEEITNQSFVLLASQVMDESDNDNLQLDLESVPILINDIFLRKNLSAYMNWKSRKSLITFRVSHADYDYQESPISEKSETVDVSWRFHINNKVTLNMSGYYRQRKYLPVSSKEILTTTEISLDRNIWTNANVSGSIVNANLDADNNNLDYSQNRLTLTVRMRW